MQNVPDNFTHLEVHSHYTLLGGTASVDEIVQHAAADNLSALALTDTNTLYGTVQFTRLCKEANIKKNRYCSPQPKEYLHGSECEGDVPKSTTVP